MTTYAEDDMRSGWARITIRLIGPDADTLALPAAVSRHARIGRKNDIVLWDVERLDGTRLQEQFDEVDHLLTANLAWLRSLSAFHIDVFVSWSPKGPAESLTVDRKMISMIASLKGAIWISTYTA